MTLHNGLTLILAIVTLFALATFGGPITPTTQMYKGGLKLSNDSITISGISAGAAAAIQYEFAFSRSVRAAGIIAGLAFYCAQNELDLALDCSSSPELTDPDQLLGDAGLFEAAGDIDQLSNIANHTIYLWSGTADTVVNQGAMLIVDSMYNSLGVTKKTTYFNYSSEHAWITNFYGNACDYLGNPFVNNCGFDFAGRFLESSFKNMGLAWNSTKGVYNSENLYNFNISNFGAGADVSMDPLAYIYIPQQCMKNTQKCHMHMNFHGCKMMRSYLNPPDTYVSHTGLNEWAESNNIVVFYPQTVASPLIPYNPMGCFDWWGYTGSQYAVKSGYQMEILNAVLKSLAH